MLLTSHMPETLSPGVGRCESSPTLCSFHPCKGVVSLRPSSFALLRTSVLQLQGFGGMQSAQQRRASDYFKALVRLFAEFVLRFPTAELPPLPVPPRSFPVGRMGDSIWSFDVVGRGVHKSILRGSVNVTLRKL